jgi:hypothetical protein
MNIEEVKIGKTKMKLDEAFGILAAAGVAFVDISFQIDEGELRIDSPDLLNEDEVYVEFELSKELEEALEKPIHDRYVDIIHDTNVIDGILSWNVSLKEGTISGEESEIVWEEFEETVR